MSAHWKRAAVPAAAYVVLIIATLACGGPGVLEYELTDGRTVADLTADVDTSVVLVYDPADCLACDANAVRWNQARAETQHRVLLMLSRAPSETERRRLIAMRMAVDGILRPGEWASLSTPSEFLIASGESIVSTHRGTGPSPLLQHLLAVRSPAAAGR